MGLKLITPPTQQPIELSEVKEHLNIDDSDWDTLLATYIAGVTAYLDGPDGFLKQALVDQTWDLFLDEFPPEGIRIPLGPVLDIGGVFYIDDDGIEQQFSTSSYSLDDSSDFQWVLLGVDDAWPAPLVAANSVRVRFRSGYVNTTISPVAGTIPDDIRAAMLILIGDLFMNRESQVIGLSAMKLPWSAENLLRQHRKQVALA